MFLPGKAHFPVGYQKNKQVLPGTARGMGLGIEGQGWSSLPAQTLEREDLGSGSTQPQEDQDGVVREK